MGGLKDADDFKSKTRAAHREFGAALETYQNALKFQTKIRRVFSTMLLKF
jgi:hypothetical protein